MIYLMLSLVLIISCSDSSFDSDIVSVNSNESSSTQSDPLLDTEGQNQAPIESGSEQDQVDDQDDDQVSVPEMINRSYLVRECIELEPKEDEATILCRVLNEQDKAKSSASFDWTFTDTNDQPVLAEDLQVKYLEAENSWHIELRTKTQIKISVSLSTENQIIDEATATIKGDEELFGPETNTENTSSENENKDIGESLPVEEDPVSFVPTIVESFTGNAYDELNWQEYNSDISVTNEQLQCSNNETGGLIHSGLMSKSFYNYTGGSVTIEVTEMITQNAIETQPFIWGLKVDTEKRAHFLVEGETLIARYFDGGEFANVFSRAYNPASDKFFKISHEISTNNLLFEVSADGINWNVFAIQESLWALTAVSFEYNCGAWGAFSGNFGSTVDNISVYLPNDPTNL
ncbi:MAG: hypothetical protein HRU09_04800 [Oligoflexales bacterium]|nr:hypothetical protein [Oligoflexales bacterium]